MNVVTVSPKYQVVIPSALRRRLNWQPGLKLMAIERENTVQLVPVTDPQSLRGAFPNLNTKNYRDGDRI